MDKNSIEQSPTNDHNNRQQMSVNRNFNKKISRNEENATTHHTKHAHKKKKNGRLREVTEGQDKTVEEPALAAAEGPSHGKS